MRIKLGEITAKRLYEAVKRRIDDLPHRFAWQGSGAVAAKNRSMLGKLQGAYKGQRCFVMANGPSLTKLDLTQLRNEHVICMNRAYLLFEQIGFVPEFYVCINELVLEQFHDDISAMPMKKFVNWSRRELFSASVPDQMFLRTEMGLNDNFVADPRHAIGSGGTVTFACLQLAYFLGFSEVVIIGMDHSFVEKGVPNSTEVRTAEVDQSHFHPNYFPKGFKWQLPDLVRSEMAYALARTAYEAAGRKIVDATLGGKCDVFEKKEFSSLFA